MTMIEHDESPRPYPPAQQRTPADLTPWDMLDRAISTGRDMDMVERLMAMAERWQAQQARVAFERAFADAQAEIPPVTKNRHVKYDSRKPGASNTDYTFEDLAEIDRTVKPVLGRHGLSYRWHTQQEPGGLIHVTCILAHRDGHHETHTMSGMPDTSGNKNAIQALSSASTMLRRQTLKGSLGLAATEAEDDDGRASGDPAVEQAIDPNTPRVTDAQLTELRVLLANMACPEEKFISGWLNLGKVKFGRLEDMPASYYDGAVNAIRSYRPKRVDQ